MHMMRKKPTLKTEKTLLKILLFTKSQTKAPFVRARISTEHERPHNSQTDYFPIHKYIQHIKLAILWAAVGSTRGSTLVNIRVRPYAATQL